MNRVKSKIDQQKLINDKIEKNHHQSPFLSYLKEIVYGGNDGIVTTLAVISGFAGSGGQNGSNYSILAVLLFAFANLFADATSMGLGNFLSMRSEAAVYKKHFKIEQKQLKNNTKLEQEEASYLLQQEGYSAQDSQKMVDLLSKNKQFWLEFMLEKELDMHNPKFQNPASTAIATFSSFLAFGFVPIIPYLVPIFGNMQYYYSILFAALSLILLGFLRYKVTGEKWQKAIFEVLLVGFVSSLVAFMVGIFFK